MSMTCKESGSIPPTQLVDRSHSAYTAQWAGFPNPTDAVGGLEVGHFPRRGFVLQPRVAVLGYPGKDASEFRDPNWVVAKPARVNRPSGLPLPRSTAATPVGVARIITDFPRVADYSNPELWASTTTWLKPTDNRIKIAIRVQGNGQHVIFEYA